MENMCKDLLSHVTVSIEIMKIHFGFLFATLEGKKINKTKQK